MKHLLLALLLVLPATLAESQDPAPAPAAPAPAAPAPAPAAPPPPPALTPILQVQMHVWISETSEQGLRQLGTNIEYSRLEENRGDSLQSANSNVFDPLDPAFTVTMPAPDQTRFNKPLRPDQSGNLNSGIQTQAGGGLNFSLLETNHGDYDGVFRAVEQSTDSDLLSKPELLVVDKSPSEIHAGGEIPFQTIIFNAKGVPNIQVEFKQVGVKMKLTPTIGTNNLISLNIETLEVTDIARVDKVRGLDLPVISTRSQTGVLQVPNGQALVIGGLSSHVSRDSERRVPILGKIPILGTLFRSNSIEVQATTLSIFVAPTIVDLRSMNEESTNAMQFWRDGSWQNEPVIAEEMILMENEL